jgi:cytochrome o ubiquinol oxidase subunit 2
MKFTAISSSQYDFLQWIQSIQHSPNQLTQATYDQLAQPTENNAVAYYAQTDDNLYNDVIMKYMGPVSSDAEMADMPGMQSPANYGTTRP